MPKIATILAKDPVGSVGATLFQRASQFLSGILHKDRNELIHKMYRFFFINLVHKVIFIECHGKRATHFHSTVYVMYIVSFSYVFVREKMVLYVAVASQIRLGMKAPFGHLFASNFSTCTTFISWIDCFSHVRSIFICHHLYEQYEYISQKGLCF